LHILTCVPGRGAARERTLKRWRREWKFALIEADNPNWHDLSHML